MQGAKSKQEKDQTEDQAENDEHRALEEQGREPIPEVEGESRNRECESDHHGAGFDRNWISEKADGIGLEPSLDGAERIRERNGEAEVAALSGGALDLDMTAVSLDGQFAKRQAEARADHLAALGGLDLAELFEDAPEGLGRNALARVRDGE